MLNYNFLKLPSTSRNFPQANLYPDEFIHSFSTISIPNQDEWVSARFSPHPNQEGIVAIGTENGQIDICDAKYPLDRVKFYRKSMETKGGAVFDFYFNPKFEKWLISFSGKSRLELWDMESICLIYPFIGHTNSVRSASIWPENPFILVTGARDGSIMAWDLRVPTSQMQIEPCRNYQNAHGKADANSRISITGLLHIDNENVIAASSSALCGIHQWDMRYIVSPCPIRTWTVPQMAVKKEFGVTSLCWDRFKSSFFASCTNNAIYEYLPSIKSDLPISTLNGRNIDTFYVQCAASPVSDHLIVGSCNKRAYIWDLQESRKYRQNFSNFRSKLTTYLPNPKHALEGNDEIETVQWSSKANFIITIDRNFLQIWSKWTEKNEYGYPDKIYKHGMPYKLSYPELLQPNQLNSEKMENKLNFVENVAKRRFLLDKEQLMKRSPLKCLQNLPNLYSYGQSIKSFEGFKLRTPRKIAIKCNSFMTPACKIPRTEDSRLSLSTQRRAHRNLNATFQKQLTPGSGGRARKKRVATPPSGNSKPKISRRSLNQQMQNTPSESANSSSNSGILKYFSPIGTPKTNGAGNQNVDPKMQG